MNYPIGHPAFALGRKYRVHVPHWLRLIKVQSE